MKQGIVLFAHGAREPRWAEPFERLLRRVRSLCPDAEVRLAYLEIMTPGLPHSVDELIAMGCGEIRIVPVFLGEGGHVRQDLPRLVDDLRARRPDIAISCAAAAGEDSTVLDAIAAYCVRDLDENRSNDAVPPLIDII
jgi:sirohydrochlorin cobaltochelatase